MDAGHIAKVNNMELYYEVYGKGEPLLLIHGFTGSSGDWEVIRHNWTDKYQLIIPDMRGHGRSTNPNPDFTFEQVAKDFYALLDLLKIDNVKAIGCSGGANTLLHMATQQPSRIESMVIVSATPYYPEPARTFMAQSSVEAITEEQWAVLRKRHHYGDAQVGRLIDYAKTFATDFEDMNFTPALLSTITARTLIVQGDRDFLYPIDLTIELYKAIPNSSLWIIPNANHGPIFDDLDYFIKTSTNFLSNYKH